MFERPRAGPFFLSLDAPRRTEGFLLLLSLLGIYNHELLSVDFKFFFLFPLILAEKERRYID